MDAHGRQVPVRVARCRPRGRSGATTTAAPAARDAAAPTALGARRRGGVGRDRDGGVRPGGQEIGLAAAARGPPPTAAWHELVGEPEPAGVGDREDAPGLDATER